MLVCFSTTLCKMQERCNVKRTYRNLNRLADKSQSLNCIDTKKPTKSIKMVYLRNARLTKRYITEHTLTFPASYSFSKCKKIASIK